MPSFNPAGRRLVTNAVLELLRRGTGKKVGDHKAPTVSRSDESGWPYCIVYAIPGGQYFGSELKGPETDLWQVIQVTSVGLNREQAEWMGDRVRLTLLGRDGHGEFQVAFSEELADRDRTRVAARMAYGGPGGVDVEGTPPNEVFSVVERYAFATTPV